MWARHPSRCHMFLYHGSKQQQRRQHLCRRPTRLHRHRCHNTRWQRHSKRTRKRKLACASYNWMLVSRVDVCDGIRCWGLQMPWAVTQDGGHVVFDFVRFCTAVMLCLWPCIKTKSHSLRNHAKSALLPAQVICCWDTF